MKNIKQYFPIFSHLINGNQHCYLDNASTTHKPQIVLDAMHQYYTTTNANISRGIYTLGEQATQAYANARANIAQFIGAASPSEVIFTSGATDGINRIAATWALDNLQSGDEILLTELEHHANLVPWQQVAQAKGAQLRFIPVFADGSLDYTYLDIISPKTKLVAVTQTSNAIGTHVDLMRVVRSARLVGARVLIDAAQSVAHQKIDVQRLDADFLVFSGHKLFGPTGIGVLYIKRELHDQVRPYAFGGGMVTDVDWTHARWAMAPQKFEAGTPPIAQAIGLSAAVDFMREHIDFDELRRHEAALCAQLIAGLERMSRITILGPIAQLKERGHIVSFVVDGIHAHDVAHVVDYHGISVRAGNHCAQPLVRKLGYRAIVRVSFCAYNTAHDVEWLLDALYLLVEGAGLYR